ncbi:hypothetical protein PRO82_000098 [Candidatus Protochlamydia amoebophila]|nr:hypothetical protein [Candidatus Protochlamydia amoebophila]
MTSQLLFFCVFGCLYGIFWRDLLNLRIFASRVAAIPLIITMLIASATAHQESLKSIFRNPTEFVAESPFNFLLIFLLLAQVAFQLII